MKPGARAAGAKRTAGTAELQKGAQADGSGTRRTGKELQNNCRKTAEQLQNLSSVSEAALTPSDPAPATKAPGLVQDHAPKMPREVTPAEAPDRQDARAGAMSALLARIEVQAFELCESECQAVMSLLGRIERRTRPAPTAPAWTLDPTQGDAARWPEAWAEHLPRWIARAMALGLQHRERFRDDEFCGTRRELVALGILAEGDFPGDAGRGRGMVTFAEDGRPKRKGEHAARRTAVRVIRLGARFAVQVRPPLAAENRRRRLGAIPELGGDDDPSGAILETLHDRRRPGLRLVHSRDA